jgi:hypothetical protein
MSEENVDAVKALFAAFALRDFEAGLKTLCANASANQLIETG